MDISTSETKPLLIYNHSLSSIQDSDVSRKLVQGNSSSFGAVFIVINAAMGAGLLTFPFAYFLTGGWQWGIVVQLVRIALYCTLRMLWCYVADTMCDCVLQKMYCRFCYISLVCNDGHPSLWYNKKLKLNLWCILSIHYHGNHDCRYYYYTVIQ